MGKMRHGSLGYLIVALLGVAGLLLASFVPVFGAPASGDLCLQSTLVSVDPSEVTVAVGATVTVELRVSGVMDLDSLELYMTYDPAVIEAG
jgi:hypothetical protein